MVNHRMILNTIGTFAIRKVAGKRFQVLFILCISRGDRGRQLLYYGECSAVLEESVLGLNLIQRNYQLFIEYCYIAVEFCLTFNCYHTTSTFKKEWFLVILS